MDKIKIILYGTYMNLKKCYTSHKNLINHTRTTRYFLANLVSECHKQDFVSYVPGKIKIRLSFANIACDFTVPVLTPNRTISSLHLNVTLNKNNSSTTLLYYF